MENSQPNAGQGVPLLSGDPSLHRVRQPGQHRLFQNSQVHLVCGRIPHDRDRQDPKIQNAGGGGEGFEGKRVIAAGGNNWRPDKE